MCGLPCCSKQICSKWDKLLTEWTWDPETEKSLGKVNHKFVHHEKQSNYIKDIGMDSGAVRGKESNVIYLLVKNQ